MSKRVFKLLSFLHGLKHVVQETEALKAVYLEKLTRLEQELESDAVAVIEDITKALVDKVTANRLCELYGPSVQEKNGKAKDEIAKKTSVLNMHFGKLGIRRGIVSVNNKNLGAMNCEEWVVEYDQFVKILYNTTSKKRSIVSNSAASASL